MYRVLSKCVMLGFALAAPALMAQDMKPAPEPGHAMVSLYRIAPGKQLAFLKWMATRDAIDQQLKLPRAHWYAHMDGDSWDYIAIGPQLTLSLEHPLLLSVHRHGREGFLGGG